MSRARNLIELTVRSDFRSLRAASPAGVVESILEDTTHSADEIARAAATTEVPASPEQASAGNYRKGKIKIQGLDISIENAKGSFRSGIGADGKPWKVKLPAHYGYITKVRGRTAPRGPDKDHIDVYVGPNPHAFMVYVVNQNKLGGGFDEIKTFIGFDTKSQAVATYDAAFTGNLGRRLRGKVITTAMPRLRRWLLAGKTQGPFTG